MSQFRKFALVCSIALVAAGCATAPPPAAVASPPADHATPWLLAGETVRQRFPAFLHHGHDMRIPEYDDPMGYRPVPIYNGELLLTDRRLLFIEVPARPEPSLLSIPYNSIVGARPSQTPLLNYVVVWHRAGEVDSFVVDARYLRGLHHQIGEVLFRRSQGEHRALHEQYKDGK